jgi:adenine-specific DNA-methyltransferase
VPARGCFRSGCDELAQLFPNCVTESRDAGGKLVHAIDLDQLRQELSGSIVDGPQERYELNWPGKREAKLTANAPIAKTLRPCRQESVDFDTTKNLFIEGDNLDALKLLQESYLAETNGRFHSDWLSMMYPRLRLARTPLKGDGVILQRNRRELRS